MPPFDRLRRQRGAPRAELSILMSLRRRNEAQIQPLRKILPFKINILSLSQTFSILPLASSPILAPLLSWDRMITGIRESGRPMAVMDSGVHGGRSP